MTIPVAAPPGADAHHATLGTGQLSPEELDGFIALFDDPGFVWMGPVPLSVWGRRPIG